MTKPEAEKIYTEYKAKVEGYIYGKVQNGHDAEDLVSSVFLKVYRGLDSFNQQKASVSTWIYSITKNTVIDYYRTHRDFFQLNPDVTDGYDACSDVESEEILSLLADALAVLDPTHRDLIILHYYDGKTLKQIATDLGMSYINAKIIHRKALRFLRTKLNPDE